MIKKLFVLLFVSACSVEAAQPEKIQDVESTQPDNWSYKTDAKGTNCFLEATLQERKFGVEIAKTYYFDCASGKRNNPVSDSPPDVKIQIERFFNQKQILNSR